MSYPHHLTGILHKLANTIDLEMKKLYNNTFVPEATEKAQMVVDSEDAADKEQLKELIAKETNRKTSSLQKEIASLHQQLQSLSKPSR